MPRRKTQSKVIKKEEKGVAKKVAAKKSSKKTAAKKTVKTPKAVIKKAASPKVVSKKKAVKKTVSKKKIIKKMKTEDKVFKNEIVDQDNFKVAAEAVDKPEVIVEDLIEADRVTFNKIVAIEEASERKKRVLMWFSVSTVMVLIVFLWSFNLRSSFKQSDAGRAGVGVEWQAFKSSFSSSVDEIKNGVNKIQEVGTIEGANAEIDEGEIQELKNHLKKLEQKLEG